MFRLCQRREKALGAPESIQNLFLLRYHIDIGFLSRRYLEGSPDIADCGYRFLDQLHACRILRKTPVLAEHRPGGCHNRLLIRVQCAVNFLGKERHKRMQKLQRIGQDQTQNRQLAELFLLCSAVENRFGHLDIPVAEFLPDEIIDLLNGNAQLIAVHIVGDIRSQLIHLIQNPSVRGGELFRINGFRHFPSFHIHKDKTGCIPDLVGEIPACLHPFPVKTHIVSGRISGHQSQAKGVRPIFINNLQRIYSVAQ